jgi:hypothetical protein
MIDSNLTGALNASRERAGGRGIADMLYYC